MKVMENITTASYGPNFLDYMEPEFEEISPQQEVDTQSCDTGRGQGQLCMAEKSQMKRQALQDMAGPLRAWLHEHKDHPYPSKAEKVLLAMGSQMTLVQVSNWFANARRRLKTDPSDMSWSKKRRLYKKKNAAGDSSGNERPSSSSYAGSMPDNELKRPFCDSDSTEANYLKREMEHPPAFHTWSPPLMRDPFPLPDHLNSSTHKYKQSILNRYLNDSVMHAYMCQSGYYQPMWHEGPPSWYPHYPHGVRPVLSSGSLSSNEYEDVGREEKPEQEILTPTFLNESLMKIWDEKYRPQDLSQDDIDTYWLEIDAALALTNMSRAKKKQNETCLTAI